MPERGKELLRVQGRGAQPYPALRYWLLVAAIDEGAGGEHALGSV